ncbi:Octopamine receptor 1 [Gossypium arboreum]|uniref:Octopamine receptor 1 n=1 Tax=Gossypium arboreum TaxID=29729 RepID=A0A0B0PI29_GOSAR|nr:Octopamine receptor 1 [Gossypium arboreum]
MKDIKATVSSGIFEDRHHTIEPYFGLTQLGWQVGYSNGLFLSTRVGTWACVSNVCNTRPCCTTLCPLEYPTIVSQARAQPRHTGVWLAVWPKLDSITAKAH